MKKLQPYFSKKTSWILLTLLFVFDNIVSYFAIAQWGGHEGNLVIAPLVEKYPLLYFLAIPITIVIMFVIVRTILAISMFFLRNWKINAGIIERIILTSVVIYWTIGNSSMNLFFLIGRRQPLRVWGYTSLLGIAVTILYVVVALAIVSRKEHSDTGTQRHSDTEAQ